MIVGLHRLTAQLRWLRASCSQGYLSYWIVGITAVSIAAVPLITPYSFGRESLTRLEIVLAALQLGGVLLAMISTFQISAAVLDDGRSALVIVRTIDRDRIVALSIAAAGLRATRWLLLWAPAAILAGLEGGAVGGRDTGRDVALSNWFRALAFGYLSITLQIFAVCALGFLMSILLSPILGTVATLAVFVASHASVSFMPFGSGSVVSQAAAIALKFLPRFADLTPANLLDDRGRIDASILVIALVHGAAVTIVLATCCGFLVRRRDL